MASPELPKSVRPELFSREPLKDFPPAPLSLDFQAQVIEELPICELKGAKPPAETLKGGHQLTVYHGPKTTEVIPVPVKETPTNGLIPPNFAELNKILFTKELTPAPNTKGVFQYSGPNSKSPELLFLCRSQDTFTYPSSKERHHIYAYKSHNILHTLACSDSSKPFTSKIPKQPTDAEILLMNGLGLEPRQHFCFELNGFDPNNKVLKITTQFDELDNLKEIANAVGNHPDLFTPQRAKELKEGLLLTLAPELKRKARHDEGISDQPWMKFLSFITSLAMVAGVVFARAQLAIARGQLELSRTQLDFTKAQLDIAREHSKLLEASLAKNEAAENIDPRNFLTEVSNEEATAPNYTRFTNGQDRLDKMGATALKPEGAHMVITGPTGAGKSELAKGFYAFLAQGEIPDLEHYRRMVFDTTAFAAAAAKYVGNLEKAFDTFIRFLEGSDTYTFVYIEEAQLLAGLGATELKPTGFLDLLKRHMTNRNSKVVFIFDTNEIVKLIGGDLAFLGRLTIISLKPFTFEECIAILKTTQPKITEEFQITLSEDALKAAAHYSRSHVRRTLSGTADFLNTIIGKIRYERTRAIKKLSSNEATPDKPVHFEEKDIVEYFARENSLTIEEATAHLEQLKSNPDLYPPPSLKELNAKDFPPDVPPPPEDEGPPSSEEPPAASGEGRPADHIEKGPVNGKGHTAEATVQKEALPEKVAQSQLRNTPSRTGSLLGDAKEFTIGAVPLIGLDVAEHTGLITSTQRVMGDAEAAVLMTWANPYTPAHLTLMAAPFSIGKALTEEVAQATGVEALKKESLPGKILGTIGGLLGAAGVTKLLGGAEVWHHASVTLQNRALSVVGSVGSTIENTVTSQFQALQMGARLYAGQAVSAAREIVSTSRNALIAATPIALRLGGEIGKIFAKRLAQGAAAALANGGLPVGDAVAAGLLLFSGYEVIKVSYAILTEKRKTT